VKVKQPIRIIIPESGVLVAQSAHEPGFTMPFEAHDFYEIYYLIEGAIQYFEPDAARPLELAAGDVCPIGPGRFHRIADVRPSALLLLCLGRDFMHANPARLDLWRELESRLHRPIHTDSAARERLEKFLRRIMVEQTTPRPAAALASQGVADLFLVELARIPDHSDNPTAEARVAGLLRELELRFYEGWTLDKAAAAARLSRRRFSQLFRQAAGATFQKTLTRLRIEHATRLLRREARASRQRLSPAVFVTCRIFTGLSRNITASRRGGFCERRARPLAE
jgi:AraC-like DNA-binding protein/quercetin dioxygenase-like cupin family protein